MPYRKKYKPTNYREIDQIIHRVLEMPVDHKFKVKVKDNHKLRVTYLIREFLHLQDMSGDYIINKTNDGLMITRIGKVDYEISEPEPVDRAMRVGSGDNEEHTVRSL